MYNFILIFLKTFFAVLILHFSFNKSAIGAEVPQIIGQDYNHCLRAISVYETKYSIPKGLLHSIAIVESGLWNNDRKRLLPHPWALNINGKGYYFKTQVEALTAFKAALADGIENIDVGCGQINWKVHGKQHFKKPEHALNPMYNIAYTAYFLTQNFQETKSWRDAIAIYHSRTKERGDGYYEKVKAAWRSVADTPQYRVAMGSGENPLLRVASRTHHKLIVQNNNARGQSVTNRLLKKDASDDKMIVFARSGSDIDSNSSAIIQ